MDEPRTFVKYPRITAFKPPVDGPNCPSTKRAVSVITQTAHLPPHEAIPPKEEPTLGSQLAKAAKACQNKKTTFKTSHSTCSSAGPIGRLLPSVLAPEQSPISIAGAGQSQNLPMLSDERRVLSQGYEAKKWDADLCYHNTLFDSDSPVAGGQFAMQSVHAEELKTTPLFSASVLKRAAATDRSTSSRLLPQYGLIAKILEEYDHRDIEQQNSGNDDGKATNVGLSSDFPSPYVHKGDLRLFLNINAPWSTFICDSQGSGKSHTLSCMLESSLLPSQLGPLGAPLAGMVFHYDKFTGFSSSQICEAAYLCSTGIPVRVLVSASSFHKMKRIYENLPGVPNDKRPVVMPLFLKEEQLNVERMMKLMAIEDEGRTALYMEIVCRILRSMALRNPDNPGLNYQEFKRRLDLENFNPAQAAMVTMRLGLLESFMYWPDVAQKPRNEAKPSFQDSRKGKLEERSWEDKQDQKWRAQLGKATTWSFAPGSLTIIDLSCPFVDESAACAMFNICLALFLEEGANTGRMIVLDEAHKFMTGTDSGNVFTESLLSVIRQQRHLAARVIIATQEPTISPALLDLSSMTIVHRFTSPEWLKALSAHLAAASGAGMEEESAKRNLQRILKRIVTLEAGQALLFSPSAMLTPENGEGLQMRKLGLQYVKVRVRKRLTADGGRSILAT